MQIIKQGLLIRNGADVSFRESTEESPMNNQEETVLIKLKRNNDRLEMEPINTNQPNDRLWKVIRNLNEKGYKIKDHDIIKLGRMKFRVKEFRTADHYFDELETASPHQGFDESKNIEDTDNLKSHDEEDEAPSCRF